MAVNSGGSINIGYNPDSVYSGNNSSFGSFDVSNDVNSVFMDEEDPAAEDQLSPIATPQFSPTDMSVKSIKPGADGNINHPTIQFSA